jgi:hypothetical protein
VYRGISVTCFVLWPLWIYRMHIFNGSREPRKMLFARKRDQMRRQCTSYIDTHSHVADAAALIRDAARGDLPRRRRPFAGQAVFETIGRETSHRSSTISLFYDSDFTSNLATGYRAETAECYIRIMSQGTSKQGYLQHSRHVSLNFK